MQPSAMGTAEEFREAMSRLAIAVGIVTTMGRQKSGFTAPAVWSVTVVRMTTRSTCETNSRPRRADA